MKILAPFAIIFLLAGCTAGTQHWYNPGQAQVDFDQDAQECELIAQEFARQATLTGKREDPEAYVRTYNNCLYAKGWSVQAPGAAGNPAEALPLLAGCKESSTIQGFERIFTVPPGYVLKSDVTQPYGPTLMQNLFFAGPDQNYINFTFQRGLTRDFVPTDYPAKEPFSLYEEGALRDSPDRLRWALFSGNIQGGWVVGLGGYLLLDDRQRVSIVITHPLPSPTKPPLPGLRLSSEQIRAVEQFRKEWLPWLESQAIVHAPKKTRMSRVMSVFKLR